MIVVLWIDQLPLCVSCHYVLVCVTLSVAGLHWFCLATDSEDGALECLIKLGSVQKNYNEITSSKCLDMTDVVS